MKRKEVFALAAGLALVAGCSLFRNAEEPYADTVEEGFVPLIAPNSMAGWAGATSVYSVDGNGVLECHPERKRPAGVRGDIWTERSFTNFVLRFEFVMPKNGNNGLGIRISDIKKDAAYHAMCELQLLDDGGPQYYDAKNKKDKLKPYQYTGSVYGVVPCLRDNFDKQIWGKENNFTGGGSYVRKPGMWNFEEVRVIGSRIQVILNGYMISDADIKDI